MILLKLSRTPPAVEVFIICSYFLSLPSVITSLTSDFRFEVNEWTVNTEFKRWKNWYDPSVSHDQWYKFDIMSAFPFSLFRFDHLRRTFMMHTRRSGESPSQTHPRPFECSFVLIFITSVSALHLCPAALHPSASTTSLSTRFFAG